MSNSFPFRIVGWLPPSVIDIFTDPYCRHFSQTNVDNYGAMDAYIKGTSTNAQIRRILLAFEEAECLHHSWPWLSRVSSKSNCADDPSRGELKGLVGPGFVRDSCFCPITGPLVADLP